MVAGREGINEKAPRGLPGARVISLLRYAAVARSLHRWPLQYHVPPVYITMPRRAGSMRGQTTKRQNQGNTASENVHQRYDAPGSVYLEIWAGEIIEILWPERTFWASVQPESATQFKEYLSASWAVVQTIWAVVQCVISSMKQ